MFHNYNSHGTISYKIHIANMISLLYPKENCLPYPLRYIDFSNSRLKIQILSHFNFSNFPSQNEISPFAFSNLITIIHPTHLDKKHTFWNWIFQQDKRVPIRVPTPYTYTHSFSSRKIDIRYYPRSLQFLLSLFNLLFFSQSTSIYILRCSSLPPLKSNSFE